MQRLVDCLLDGQQVASGCRLACPLAFDVIALGLVVKMLTHASLAKGHLVGHTEGVYHIIVLIAKEDARLDGLLGLRRVVLPLVMHWLCGVHLVHVGLVVHAWLLLARVADLAIISYLVHIVTHVCLKCV